MTRRWRAKRLTIWTQNLRGLKSTARLAELFDSFRRRRVFAACVQETWRVDKDDLHDGGCALVSVGLTDAEQSRRGSQGVGVLLSCAGLAAWKKANHEEHRDLGARVMALRLVVRAPDGTEKGLFLVSAYAPIGCSSAGEWEDFFAKLDECCARKRAEDVLLIGLDSNSSVGVRSDVTEDEAANTYSPLGSFGLSHINDSGRRFLNYMATHEYAAASTWFRKRSYGTWLHPRSRLQHQVDHFVCEQSERKRITDCGSNRPLLGSDHRGVSLTIDLSSRVKKTSDARSRLLGRDFTCLEGDEEVDFEYRQRYASRVAELVRERQGHGESRYARLTSAMQQAACDVLPKRERAQPGFFERSQDVLRRLIDRRNEAIRVCFRTRRATRSSLVRLKESRRQLKRAVETAKSEWIEAQMTELNGAANSANGFKSHWDALKRLKAGLSKTRKAPPKRMRKADGSLASSPEENAAVFAAHFSKLYGREEEFDWSVLDEIPQLDEMAGLDRPPSDLEICKTIGHLRNTAPGISGLKAVAYKALLADESAAAEIKAVVMEFWEEETMPEEWESGLLAILPKKGDLSAPGNHRGIMLLEVAYKIVAIILCDRLEPVCESLDHESQCGFRSKRGTTDAIFQLKMALKKRREHGLESWAYLIDLVKAFDRVPRVLLWLVLEKFGASPKLVRLLKAVHEKVKVRFDVDGVTVVLESIIGVKQGDIPAPKLFVIFMAAITMTWKKTHKYNRCVFRSKPDWVLSGRRFNAGNRSDEFEVTDSMYADDSSLLFCSRKDVETNCPKVNSHFGRFGMQVHARARTDPNPAKSEVLFVAAPGILYDDPETFSDAHRDGIIRPRDLSDVDVGNGTCPVVDRFKYLGSFLHRKCRDTTDVDERVKKAGAAFAALRKCIFDDRRVSLTAKRSVYVSLILAILLYACEAWCLTEVMFKRLRDFHSACVRRMLRVTRKHMWTHRITDASLRSQLGVETIDEYISRRQLSWAGAVARMPFDRLPRRMISSWVCARRPVGAPQFTYARGLHKALDKMGIDRSSWHQKAQDPAGWRALIGQHTPAST